MNFKLPYETNVLFFLCFRVLLHPEISQRIYIVIDIDYKYRHMLCNTICSFYARVMIDVNISDPSLKM